MWFNLTVTKISEAEFSRIVEGLLDDADLIVKHNPIGTRDETLMWMLLSCLLSYLSIADDQAPCFTGRPDAATYAEAIRFIVRPRQAESFDVDQYLSRLSAA